MKTLILFGEPYNSGLIFSQAISPFVQNKIPFKVINIYSPRDGKGKSDCANKLFVANVLFPFPRRFVNSFLFIPISFVYSLLLGFFYLNKDDELIARGYPAALLAYFIYRLRKINYYFDTRSMFIHEQASLGKIKKRAAAWRLWRWLEYIIASNAKKIGVVSKFQFDYFKKICCTEVVINPCFLETYFMQDSGLVKKAHDFKVSNNIGDDDIVILYYGSLSSHWNDLRRYEEFFKIAVGMGYKIIVMSQNHGELKGNSFFKDNESVLLYDARLHDRRVPFYLADYGVILFGRTFDWRSRLSVKVVSYLGWGLRVILNENVGEARRVLKSSFPRYLYMYNDGVLQKLSKNPKGNIAQHLVDVKQKFGYQNFVNFIS